MFCVRRRDTTATAFDQPTLWRPCVQALAALKAFVRSLGVADPADTEAEPDAAAIHGGCPVIQGDKWIATRWMRSANFS